MRSTTFRALALILLAACFPQAGNESTTGPRVVIKLPGDIEPGSLWIRYVADRYIRRGEFTRLDANSREYVIYRSKNTSERPENVKIVIYSRGCQFKIYDLNPTGNSDSEERFSCDPLPMKTLHGTIDPTEIPRAIYYGLDKKVDVVGELEADWICSFFLEPNGGSCLSSGISLGILGAIDPADGGKFDLTIPDFSRDPIFKRTNDWRSKFGTIALLLRDHRVQTTLGAIRPKESSPSDRGLKVEADLPERLEFTRAR